MQPDCHSDLGGGPVTHTASRKLHHSLVERQASHFHCVILPFFLPHLSDFKGCVKIEPPSAWLW